MTLTLDKSFLKINKHYSNLHQYNYWKDGFLKIQLNNQLTNNYLKKNLKKIFENQEDSFYIKDKYKQFNQLDYKLNIKNLDFCVEFIKASNLINILNFITCNDLILSDLNIRINKNRQKKSKFWGKHRDTSYLKGRVPPTKILIYYPDLKNQNLMENELKIWSGSHKMIFSNSRLDNFFSFFQKKKLIKTDDENMILFDGALMHEVGIPSDPQGSLRLIFGFIDKHQFHDQIDNYDNIVRWNKILNDD
jgi:hypothetical protein